jgi:hypothetical protein
VPLIFLLRGATAALVAGVVVGGIWGYIAGERGFAGFFLIFVAMGVGWAISEAISLATNRKRGTALQACAVVSVMIAYLVHNVVGGGPVLPAGDLWGYLAAGFAAVFAVSRLSWR